MRSRRDVLGFAAASVAVSASGAAWARGGEELLAYRIVAVEARATPDVSLSWPFGLLAYIQHKKLNPNDPANGGLASTPEGRAWMGERVAAQLRDSLRRNAVPAFKGLRPAKLVGTVKSMSVPSHAQRMIIGGIPTIAADVALVDATSGRVIAAYTGGTDWTFAGMGFSGTLAEAALSQAITGTMDHSGRLTDAVATSFVNWIKSR